MSGKGKASVEYRNAALVWAFDVFSRLKMAYIRSTLIEHSPTVRLVSRLFLIKVPALGLNRTEAPKSMTPGRRRNETDFLSKSVALISKAFDI